QGPPEPRPRAEPTREVRGGRRGHEVDRHSAYPQQSRRARGRRIGAGAHATLPLPVGEHGALRSERRRTPSGARCGSRTWRWKMNQSEEGPDENPREMHDLMLLIVTQAQFDRVESLFKGRAPDKAGRYFVRS